ncbi:MAG: hypothetical protein ABUL72_03795, partial [Armatimonadota bacterium]
KMQVMRARILGGLAVGGLIAFYVTLTTKNIAIGLPSGFVAAALFAVLFPVLVRFRMQRQIKTMHEKGRSKRYTCAHELVIDGEDFVAKTPFESTRTEISKISHVDLTPTHGFIRTGPLGGFIVPIDRLDEGDWPSFYQELDRKMSANIATSLRASRA